MIFSITEAASHFALCKITVGVCVWCMVCVWCVCARVWILWACTGRGQAGTQAGFSIFHLCVSSFIYLGESSSFHLLFHTCMSCFQEDLSFPGLSISSPQPGSVQSSSLSPCVSPVSQAAWSSPHPPNHTHTHCSQAWNSMPMMCEWKNVLVGYCISF